MKIKDITTATKASAPVVELVSVLVELTVLGHSDSYPFDLSNELQFSPSTNNP